MGIKHLPFGVEIEMTGITREKASNLIKQYFNNDFKIDEIRFKDNIEGNADEYRVYDNYDQDWIILDDTTIKPEKGFTGESKHLKDYRVELITPILSFNDIRSIELFKDIILLLEKNGAKVNDTCGMHVHIDANKFKANNVKRLVNSMNTIQHSLYKVLNVPDKRMLHITKIDQKFIDKINSSTKLSLRSIKKMWENMTIECGKRDQFVFRPEKYFGLNIYSMFIKGTIEFRMFNSTLNRKKIMANIDFCQSLSTYSLNKEKAFESLYSLDDVLRPFMMSNSNLSKYSGALKPYLELYGMNKDKIECFCEIDKKNKKLEYRLLF